MIITIAGLPGAGKTATARALAKVLGMPHYSMGDLRGQMALSRGLTIDEFNSLPENTDEVVDQHLQELGKTQDNFIVDSLIAWHFIPQSFKIFLDVDSDEGARRIFAERQTKKDKREDEPVYQSIAETKEILANRVANTNARFQKYYGQNFLDQSQYNLVIDTTKTSKEEVVATILAAIDKFKAKR